MCVVKMFSALGLFRSVGGTDAADPHRVEPPSFSKTKKDEVGWQCPQNVVSDPCVKYN